MATLRSCEACFRFAWRNVWRCAGVNPHTRDTRNARASAGVSLRTISNASISFIAGLSPWYTQRRLFQDSPIVTEESAKRLSGGLRPKSRVAVKWRCIPDALARQFLLQSPLTRLKEKWTERIVSRVGFLFEQCVPDGSREAHYFQNIAARVACGDIRSREQTIHDLRGMVIVCHEIGNH